MRNHDAPSKLRLQSSGQRTFETRRICRKPYHTTLTRVYASFPLIWGKHGNTPMTPSRTCQMPVELARQQQGRHAHQTTYLLVPRQFLSCNNRGVQYLFLFTPYNGSDTTLVNCLEMATHKSLLNYRVDAKAGLSHSPRLLPSFSSSCLPGRSESASEPQRTLRRTRWSSPSALRPSVPAV